MHEVSDGYVKTVGYAKILKTEKTLKKVDLVKGAKHFIKRNEECNMGKEYDMVAFALKTTLQVNETLKKRIAKMERRIKKLEKK